LPLINPQEREILHRSTDLSRDHEIARLSAGSGAVRANGESVPEPFDQHALDRRDAGAVPVTERRRHQGELIVPHPIATLRPRGSEAHYFEQRCSTQIPSCSISPS